MSIPAAVPGQRAQTNQNTSHFQNNHQNLSINTARNEEQNQGTMGSASPEKKRERKM
jgi:hypothetical protein